MFNKPKWRTHFRVEIIESKVVYLLSELGNFALTGKPYVLLAPYLNGHHTVDRIVDEVRGQIPIAVIYYSLILLENKGYITEAVDSNIISPQLEYFWNLLNVDIKFALNKLQKTKINVRSLCEVSTSQFLSAIESFNICIEEKSNLSNLSVVLVNDYLQSQLKNLNEEALRSNTVWMLVKPVGSIIWIGPIFIPGKTACWQCLAQRLENNRELETILQKIKPTTLPVLTSSSVLPASLNMALELAAMEVAKWVVVEEYEQLENGLITFDLLSLKAEHHFLTKRPQCKACGNLHPSVSPNPLFFKDPLKQKKKFIEDGGHRTLSADESFNKYKHHISPITGVVNNLQKTYPEDNHLIHVYTSVHKFPTFDSNLDNLLSRKIQHKSAGKGKTDIQARTSALCEAIERYSGIYSGDEIRLKSTYNDIENYAIHPNDCMLFSQNQYRTRQERNAQNLKYQWVPELFDESRKIEWTPVWSLTNQMFKYLPTAYCYYGYPFSPENRFCRADSNGAAAGNTIEEAILQGFMELVERDSVALWWYNRVTRPSVNIESFDEPYLIALIKYYKSLRRNFWVLDITSDIGIPSFAAITSVADEENPNIIFGFGSHFDSKIAILRAVTEVNQVLWNSAKITGDTVLQGKDLRAWRATASFKDYSFLCPDEKTRPKVYSEYQNLYNENLQTDIIACIEIGKKHGMEILVLDQTRPDIGLNVVKVVVPGIRHFWARFAPGRLYDAPVNLGWLKSPLLENQLNPIPMMM